MRHVGLLASGQWSWVHAGDHLPLPPPEPGPFSQFGYWQNCVASWQAHISSSGCAACAGVMPQAAQRRSRGTVWSRRSQDSVRAGGQSSGRWGTTASSAAGRSSSSVPCS